VLAVAADRRRGAGDAGLDALLQFLWCNGHQPSLARRFTE
jgi:hypothetical protein